VKPLRNFIRFRNSHAAPVVKEQSRRRRLLQLQQRRRSRFNKLQLRTRRLSRWWCSQPLLRFRA
jgi:hypothetical protein